jgi:hypothetical protein
MGMEDASEVVVVGDELEVEVIAGEPELVSEKVIKLNSPVTNYAVLNKVSRRDLPKSQLKWKFVNGSVHP